MAENAREIVLDTLLEIERNKVFSSQVLKSVLDKYDYLDVQEKRFIKRLTEGCIERKIELDYYLNQFSSIPVNKMKPLIRCLMRMGTYQILYMDKVPDAAACNEAVKLAVKRKFVNLKGFVNGVLRKISSNKENLPMPDEKDTVQYFSVKYSVPEWIVSLWFQEYGKNDTGIILEAMERIHPVCVRFKKNIEEQVKQDCLDVWRRSGVKVKQTALISYAYWLEGVEGVSSLYGYTEGFFTVQDISSILCVEAAGVKETDVCMDICAAPGGKTMLAAESAKMVLARDVSAYKVSLIEENCERMNLLQKVETQVWDATVFDENKVEYADVVFMDVPCSGLGVMGKKRDIKYNVNLESLIGLEELQKQIVENSYRYVKKGGILMYSTCTIRKEENTCMSRWICEKFPFVLEEEKQILPGFEEGDGFYYARLRRI